MYGSIYYKSIIKPYILIKHIRILLSYIIKVWFCNRAM